MLVLFALAYTLYPCQVGYPSQAVYLDLLWLVTSAMPLEYYRLRWEGQVITGSIFIESRVMAARDSTEIAILVYLWNARAVNANLFRQDLTDEEYMYFTRCHEQFMTRYGLKVARGEPR